MRAFLPIALVVAFACLSDGCGSKCETTAAPSATEKTGATMNGAGGSVLADGGLSDGGVANEFCSACPMEAAAKASCADKAASSCGEEKACSEEQGASCPSEAKPAENVPSR